MKKKSPSVIAVALCGVLTASSASAALFPVRGAKIVRLLSDGVNFGYCMAFLDAKGQSDMAAASGCNVNAVSFNCQALPEFNMSKQEASRNWSAAQLAYVTGTAVNIDVDNASKYNTQYCVARRIDNLPQ